MGDQTKRGANCLLLMLAPRWLIPPAPFPELLSRAIKGREREKEGDRGRDCNDDGQDATLLSKLNSLPYLMAGRQHSTTTREEEAEAEAAHLKERNELLEIRLPFS